MTADEKKEHQKKKRRLANAMRACRIMIGKGRFDRAEEYALANGFTTAEARERSWDRGASLPIPPAPVEAVAPTPLEPARVMSVEPGDAPSRDLIEAATENFVNGWPEETDAIIWGPCRNKRILLIELPDLRQAAMWTMGRRWRNGLRVRVKLDSAVGDPIYFAGDIL